MENNRRIFHFQELDWLVSFPASGNQGRKYLYYSVEFTDRKAGKAKNKACVADIAENPGFENGYPHTVGFFKGRGDEIEKSGFCYLELRIIRSIEDFWKFLNDLDL